MKRTEIKWEAQDGRTICVSVDLITSKTIDADGHKVDVAATEINVTASIDGITLGVGRPQTRSSLPAGVAAVIGNLGINADNLARINAAIDTYEATPAWQAKQARLATSEREADEYEAHRSMMRRVMGY